MKNYKVAITGATGQIGYALSFLLPSILNKESIALDLIDLPNAKQKLKGLKCELQDANLNNITSINTHTSLDVLKEADYIILLGSAPRTNGMQRQDLLHLNGNIFKKVGQKLNNTFKKPKVLVVGNPCNTNALVAMHHSDLPSENFYAMTALDQMRAVNFLSLKFNALLKHIKHVYIYGNHSSTMVPDLTNAKVNGKSIINQITDKWYDNEFIKDIRQRGSYIIEHRESSSAASAAMAVIQTIKSMIYGSTISVACARKNPFGINSELIYSYPISFNDNKNDLPKGINVTDKISNLMRLSEQELIKERDLVCKLNLL